MTNPELGGGRYDTEETRPDSPSNLQEYVKFEAEFPKKIEKKDISARPMRMDETEIVLQRHGDYVRDRSDTHVGSLTSEAAEGVSNTAETFFKAILEQLPEAERDTVDILFVASDTQYFEGGRRSLETGNLALKAAENVFQELGISIENIHNKKGKLKGLDDKSGPRPMATLREPQFLDSHPEFANELLAKYSKTEWADGTKKLDVNFWIAFETDIETELREQYGAEGPDDIANRTAHSVDVLARYAQIYHKLNPGRRLVIWASTHYDTISPYVRREIFKQENYKDEALGVELGGGITIDIDANGRATTILNGQNLEVPIKTSGKHSD